MDFIYKIGDIGFNANSLEDLKKQLIDYFTVDGVSATVTINGDWVLVSIDSKNIEQMNKDFTQISNLCEKGNFVEAKQKLTLFINKYPRHSEAYRIDAQLKMQEGKIDDAIDANIESLRCNPKNAWALLLMGNLYGKYKNDIETAQQYYDKILEYCPNETLALNNVAAVMMERKNYKKAIPLFETVLQKDKKYANAFYGLSLCHYSLRDFQKAFDVALKGCLNADRRIENPSVLEELQKLMIASAQAVVKEANYLNVALGIKDLLEEKGHREIKIEMDENMSLAAKMEYGLTHRKPFHLVRYNSTKPFVEHLMIHEMTHLDMMLEANKADNGKVVTWTNENEMAFRARFSPWIKKLTEKIGHSKAMNVLRQLMDGLNMQIMNCPLDLFVEERIYKKYPVVRAIQLLSLLNQEQQNIKSVQEAMKAAYFPKVIVEANKVMNIVSSLHLEHLYGLRFYQAYKPTKAEFEKAKDLYEEYLAYEDYKPGEEYDLIEYFADTLQFSEFLTISREQDYLLDHSDADEDSKKEDLTEEQQKKQDDFYRQNKDGEDAGKTMMMAMYMLDALSYFKNLSKDKIKEIAFQIAMEGMKGISPEKKSGYSVPSIPEKNFSGYQFLAYYYVSWALAIPERLSVLGLPFDSAWELANQMWKDKKA